MTAQGRAARKELLRQIGLPEIEREVPIDGGDRAFAEALLSVAAAKGRDDLTRFLYVLGNICPFFDAGTDLEHEIAERIQQAANLPLDAWEREFDEEPELWPRVLDASRESVGGPSVASALYVQREIEDEVRRFVDQDVTKLEDAKTMLIIVGQSGMGKTTLMRQILNRYRQDGHPSFYISSAELPAPMSEIEPRIVNLITNGYSANPAIFKPLERKAARRNRVVIIGIDAVNEYNRANGGAPTPIDFLVKLDEMGAARKRDGARIRYIVTLRPETWKRGLANDRLRAGRSSRSYWVSGGEIAIQLGRFSAAEAASAYEKYRAEYGIQNTLHKLPDLTRYHLRDPLLLAIAAEVYRGQEIPADVETGHLFRRYEQNRTESCAKACELIPEMVANMFAGASFVIHTDTIVRDSALRAKAPALYQDLDPQDMRSPGYALGELNVLRFHGDRVRFNYDRFAEYLLSSELLARIDRAARGRSVALSKVAFEAIRANLDAGTHLVTAMRALRRTLRLLQNSEGYSRLVRDLARSDERGLTLVASTMGAIAMGQGAAPDVGLDTLSVLLTELRRDADRSPISTMMRRTLVGLGLVSFKPPFPIVDVAHRLLVDEEYRLWRRSQPAERRQRHRELLYECFVWGMFHTDEVIGAAAVQYLFFLWKDPETRHHAMQITARVVHCVGPISFGTLFSTGKRPLENLLALFLLTLPEVTDQSGTPASLPQAARLIENLNLGRLAKLGRVADILGHYLNRVFERLPYPINLDEMRQILASPEIQDAGRSVLRLLRAASGGPFPLDEALRLSVVKNGYVLQMLCYALSVYHERSSEQERRQFVSWLRSQCQKALEPQTEYVLSLTLYHMNYFGSHATPDSIALMGDMVSNILRKRKGKFKLAERSYDYNVIGTYGRVLRRHAGLLTGAREIPAEPMLRYAFEALEDAEARHDFDYYLYVCSNVGLLGVLTEPEYVFEVFAHVLETSSVRKANPTGKGFDPDRIRTAVIQSLANIRVLYRAQVDRWLLEVLEDQELYGEVTQRTGEFNLPVFCSWTTEHLMFKLLTEHYETVGRHIIVCLEESLDTGSSILAFQHALRRLFEQLVALPGVRPAAVAGAGS
jgi:hypothetical protein